MSKESTQISLAEAEAMTEEILKDYRENMLVLAKRELDLFGDEMRQAARDHAVRTRSAIEADLRDLQSERTKHWFFDSLLGVGLFFLIGSIMALLAVGFMNLFASFSKGG